MRTQEELKELYKQEMTAYWKNKKMIDYCIGKCAYLVELDNGDFYEIEKPNIKKDFCFGYGYCGVSSEEEYNGAAASAANARTNVNYFMNKNLEQIDGVVDEIVSGNHTIYKHNKYCGASPDAKLKSLVYVDYWQTVPADCIKLSDREKAAIIAGYEEVKKAFIKRLNTYLKRYGLTKINSWTYLSD